MLATLATALAIAALPTPAAAMPPQGYDCTNPSTGPDLIIGDLSDVTNWGALGSVSAYSFNPNWCNVGDEEVLWITASNQRPILSPSLYRLENGRFEQIGIGSIFQPIFPLSSAYCCSCPNGATVPGARLGVGCSTTSSGSVVGNTQFLGLRSEAEADGTFLYPSASTGQSGDRLFRRVQVPTDDVDPALHPNAVYFAELRGAALDDTLAGNAANNSTWRPLSRPGTQTQGAFRLSLAGVSSVTESALSAWEALEPGVELAQLESGALVLGSNVIDEGNGTWRYEYTLANVSHDPVVQFSIPAIEGALLTNVGMSFPLHHSGEPYTNTPWTIETSTQGVLWRTAQRISLNPNANAVRWGTAFSFWFTADQPPVASVGTFRTSDDDGSEFVPFPVRAPAQTTGGAQVARFCPALPNSTGQIGRIGVPGVDMNARTITLEATGLPPQSFGMFLTGLGARAFSMPVPSGPLCIDPIQDPIGRLVGGSVLLVDANGRFEVTASLDMMPAGGPFLSVQPGELRIFQAWHRDVVPAGGQQANFTDAAAVRFP